MFVFLNFEVSELGKKMLWEIKEEINFGRKCFFYDKYICLKVVEIDVKINFMDNVDLKGEFFREMEEFIEESLCLEILFILMLG